MDQAIELTVNWYKAREVNYDFCVRQINEYMDRASKYQERNAG